MVGKNSSDLPPGFRFHPTDEELIVFYLRNQATSRPCPVSIIPEVDIYKFDPWELPEKAEFGENEWYFFTPRDRKYPNGVRPNRAAVSGYWKATGTDKAIYSGSKYVGVKKALVFYKDRPPKGIKTDWIMHEYRLSESRSLPNKQINGSMRLDDWVLCRIYKKKNLTRTSMDIKAEDSNDDDHPILVADADEEDIDNKAQAMKLPRTCSISHLWEFDYVGSSVSQLFNDNNIYNYSTTIDEDDQNQQNMFINNYNTAHQGGDQVSQHASDQAMKYEVNHHHHQMSNSFLGQPAINYMNHGFQFQ